MGELLRSSGSFDEWDRKEGTPGPMGVTWVPSLAAWNFALYSRRATGVTLLLYSAGDPVHPLFECRLDPRINKSGRIWHCWITADRAPGATYYAYRVDGHHDPAKGYRFDPHKILLDPFAPAVFFPPEYDRIAAVLPGKNDGRAPLGVLPRTAHQANGNTERPIRPSHDLIVYELHVKGFTARANFRSERRLARDLRRVDREDPLSQGTRNHCRGTDAGAAVRPTGRQLLGLHDSQLLLAAPGLRGRPIRGGCGRRVPAHGTGAARERHRSVARRGLQPYQRSRRRRPDLQLSRYR